MKRICFLVDSVFSIGGVQRVTSVIAIALARHYHVTIVTLEAPPAMSQRSHYGLTDAPIDVRFFAYPAVGRLKQTACRAYSAVYRKCFAPLPTLNKRLSLMASDAYTHSSFPSELRNALAEELRQGHYDAIVGVHAPLAVRLASLRRQLPGVKLLGWIHNSFEALFAPTSLYIGPDRRRHYVYQLRKLDTTIVLCQHDAAQYRQYDPLMKPVVVYNPLTLTPGKPAQGTSRQFLAVGRFTPRHKGFDLLIEAFHLFAKQDADWTLHIVGEGSEEQAYRQMIHRYALEQRVFLHPFTDHIQTYYSAAQVFVLSSRWEGFGLVLVEAMAHGLPVVSSNLPTSLEIMGNKALYFDVGNVEQLATRLLDATKADWPSWSAEAKSAVHRFSIDTIEQQWCNLL